MADLLTVYAATQPDKVAVIDDRGHGDARQCTYAELEARSNQLAHVLGGLGVGPGSKVAWCGQNSTGIVEVINAARKLGATAVPVNYRLSDDEAAYVVDHCDASVVYVDAEFAPTVRPDPPDDPQGRGDPRVRRPATRRHDRCRRPDRRVTDQRVVCASRTTAIATTPGRHRRHDDLHVGHDGQAEGRVPPQRRRPAAVAGHDAVHRLPARRRVHHHRPALPLGARGLHGLGAGDGPDHRAPAQVRPGGLVAAGRHLPARPPRSRPPRRSA